MLRWLKPYFPAALLLILVLAALLRAWDPGLYAPWLDEVVVTEPALRLARLGDWTWRGTPSGWAGLSYHSPFVTYMTGLFQLVSGDMRVGRLGYALWGVLAVGLAYVAVQRYFGRRAALITALLLATLPLAVDWTRLVYNPAIALPFLPLWLLTGLMGYYEGRRWAQVVHWLCLSACMQSQAVLLLLTPLSLLLVLYRLWAAPDRRATLGYTALAFGLMALTFIPWGIGLAQTMGERDVGGLGWQLRLPPLDAALYMFASVISGLNFRFAFLNYSPERPGWWASEALNGVFVLQSAATLAALGYCAYRGLRQMRQHFPALFLVLASVLPFGLFMLNTRGHNIENFYFMSLFYTAVPALAWGLALLWERRAGRFIAAACLAVIVAANLWTLATFFDWLNRDGWRADLHPLNSYLAQMADWRATCGDDLVYLDDAFEEGIYTTKTRNLLLKSLSFSQPLRVVTLPQGIPVAPGGSLIFSAAASPHFQAWFGAGTPALPRGAGSAVLRAICLKPDVLPAPDLRPDASLIFDQQAQVIGLQAAPPQPGTPWPIALLWQPLQPADSQIQFSLRLGDANGQYGQVDFASLHPTLWRAGETVINFVEMPLSPALPTSGTLTLDVLMYRLEGVENLMLTTPDGQPLWEFIGRIPVAR